MYPGQSLYSPCKEFLGRMSPRKYIYITNVLRIFFKGPFIILFTNTNCSVVSVQKQVLEVSGNSHVPSAWFPSWHIHHNTTCTNKNIDQMLL